MRGIVASLGTIVAALLLPLGGAAQEPLRPATSTGTWLSAQVRGGAPGFMHQLLGRPADKIRLSGELGVRTADNFFGGRQLYAEAGARYKVSKKIGLSADYRYADRGRYQSNRQRVQLTAAYDHSVRRWNFDYRLVQQWTFRRNNTPSTYIRNRIGVEYDFPKWKLDPEFSVEFFTRTDRPQGWNYDGVRYKLGTSYRISKVDVIEATIIHDRDTQVAWPVNRTILSIGYVMDLRRR